VHVVLGRRLLGDGLRHELVDRPVRVSARRRAPKRCRLRERPDDGDRQQHRYDDYDDERIHPSIVAICGRLAPSVEICALKV
jgi:hypothetical protein